MFVALEVYLHPSRASLRDHFDDEVVAACGGATLADVEAAPRVEGAVLGTAVFSCFLNAGP